jgi:hypothetical protein
MWIEQALELTMDVIEKMTHFKKKASNIWNIIFKLIFDHLNGKLDIKIWGQEVCSHKKRMLK